jgi:hypothetical protein
MFCKARAALALTMSLLGACVGAHASKPVDFAAHTPSPDARYTAQWVMDTADNRGQPFAIVDKKDARLYVFAGSGKLLGATSALLGLAPGDRSAPGVGKYAPSQIPRGDRTTPAGRFATEPGHNLSGEDIVWVDYDAALAIHRLRPAAAGERRPQRLLSETPADNRISLGCVVVAVSFYESVIGPTLGKNRGVVYVLPEESPVQAMFGNTMKLAAR